MGIYLPNMEKMPRKGEMLVIFPDGTSYVCFNGMRERLAQTTAVPVPPHGRLGDLDALAKIVLNWITTQEKAYPNEDSNALSWRLGARAMGHQIYRDIEASPTIIPAEEGGE